MNNLRLVIRLFFVIILFSFATDSVIASEPAVKKSKSGICHPIGSTYYGRMKNYKSYPSMEKCLKSGGRKPKR